MTLLILCALGLAIATNPANAAKEIGLVYGEIDGWAYLPVMDGQDVDKIIALRLEPSTSPINAIWCWEDANGEWWADAWESVAWEDVAAFTFDYIGYQAGDPEVEDDLFLWPMELDIAIVTQAMGSPISPQPFGDGVFFGDALEPVVQSNPDVLEPLETLGYAAVSTMSGASMTQGTFGGVGIDPEPKDDDCIALVDLLNALTMAFVASQDDLDQIDQAFLLHYEAHMAPGCTCPTREWVVATGAWVDFCGPWSQTGGPWPEGSLCRYAWERIVSGSRTRTRAYTEPDPFTGTCIRQDCTQTQFRTGRQIQSTLSGRTDGGCPTTGIPPAPATPCVGGGFQVGPWVPALCPWEL